MRYRETDKSYIVSKARPNGQPTTVCLLKVAALILKILK